MDWVADKSWVAKSQLRSANEIDQDSQLLEDIWAEDDHLQDKSAHTEDDHIRANLMMGTGDAESTPAKKKKNTEIVIVSIRKANAEIVTVLAQVRKSTEREDKVDPTLQGNEWSTLEAPQWSDLYTINQWGRFKHNVQTFLSTFQKQSKKSKIC